MATSIVYNWANNSKRKTMKGREVKVIARGKLNSLLIEFIDNGQRECVSRNSIKQIKQTNQIKLL